jgi:hypothetical protein
MRFPRLDNKTAKTWQALITCQVNHSYVCMGRKTRLFAGLSDFLSGA